MCIPKAEGLDPTVYFPDGALPDDIVHVTPDSSPELIEEFIDGLSAAFCGTDEVAPEGSTSWGYNCSGEYTQPLPKVADDKDAFAARMAFYKWSVKFSFVTMARHGGCFALKDSDGKMVAFVMTTPPSDNRALHHQGMCEFMWVTGQLDSMPAAYTTGESAARLDLLMNTMNKAHDTNIKGSDGTKRRHIYIGYIGTLPTAQGKGHGKKLITYMTAAADHHQVPIHLESAGTRMERFWKKNDFEVKEHLPMTYSGTKDGEKQEISFQPDGLPGLSSCFREPKKP